MLRHDQFKRERRPYGLLTHKDAEILRNSVRPTRITQGFYRYRGWVFIRQYILKEFGWKNIKHSSHWRALRNKDFDLSVQTRGAIRPTLLECMAWVKLKDGKPVESNRPNMGGEFLPAYDSVLLDRIDRINKHYADDDMLDLE